MARTMLVLATGATVTAGVTSARIALGTMGSSVLRLVATGACYVKATNAAGTCTTDDMMLLPNMETYLNVSPFTHLAYIGDALLPKINITPVSR